MKSGDRVVITVKPFEGETGVIHKVIEAQPKKFPPGWSLAVILDAKEKWNHHLPMLFHLNELRMSTAFSDDKL